MSSNIRAIERLNEQEIKASSIGKGSWHDQYKDSPYIYIGGLNSELTEGDLRVVFSQYGEVSDVNLVKDNNTGAPRGFAFLSYSDQRSTVLAVDNFNGVKLAGRNLRVDHVENYKSPQDIQEQREKKRKERTRYADMVTSELFTNATESMEITKMNVNVSVDDETEEVAELAIDEPSFRVEKGNRRLRTDEEKELKRRFQEGLISEPDYQMQKKALKKTIKKLSGSTR